MSSSICVVCGDFLADREHERESTMTSRRKPPRTIDRTKVSSAALEAAIANAINAGETLTITEHGKPRAQVVVPKGIKLDDAPRAPKLSSSNPVLIARARELAAPIAAAHLCTVSALFGPGREKRVSRARQDLWRELRAAGWAYEEIGRLFGRDHTTVLHGVRTADARAAAVESFEARVACRSVKTEGWTRG